MLPLLVVWLWMGAAHASHYPLEVLAEEGWLQEDQLSDLRRFGLRDTRHLLLRTATPQERRDLARSTDLSEAQLLRLARLCEFLQIEGIGTYAAGLLMAVGVSDIQRFANEDPAALHLRLQEHLQGDPEGREAPPQTTLATWMELASQVPVLVVGP